MPNKNNQGIAVLMVLPLAISVILLAGLVVLTQTPRPPNRASAAALGISFKNIIIPGKIEAEDYDNGGEGVGYHDAETNNNGGEYRQDGVDIKSNADGGYTVGWNKTGDWLTYTVNVQTTGVYQVKARVGTVQSDNPNFTLSVDGAPVGSINVPNTSNWENLTTVNGPKVNLTAGMHLIHIDINKQWLDIDYLDFSPETADNIIKNGGFESGTTNWTFYTNGQGSLATSQPGNGGGSAARANIQTIGSNTQLYQSDITLKPNTRYSLSFSAYSNNSRDLSVSMHKHVSPYTNYGLNDFQANLNNGWKNFSTEFTTANFSSNVSDARLKFTLNGYSQAGDIYFIDNVNLTTIPSTPVVPPAAPSTQPSPQPTTPPSGGGSTVGGRGQQGTPTIPSGAVYISPGQSIQAAIDANPDGRAFVLRSGTHRISTTLNPKTGNIFIGEQGAVVSGARVLSGFSQDGSLWYANVASFNLSPDSRFPNGVDSLGLAVCEPGYSRCSAQHDLYVNNTPLRHVTSRGEVSTGEFYFDYGADRVYFADNPSGKTVELGVTEHFVASSAANLTFRNLIIEKFATPGLRGALSGPGNNWIVDNNTFRLNHGAGVKWNRGWQVTDNIMNNNGQNGGGGGGDNDAYLEGGGGSSDNVLIQNNEFANNNYARWKMNWEAGAFKIARATGVTIRNNYVHDNIGVGIWIDIDNVDIMIEGNRAENNLRAGIKYEISYKGTIRNNTARNNGGTQDEGILGAQIEVHSSSNVEVYGNTVEVPADRGDGISIFHKERGLYASTGNYVHDNTIIFNGTNVGNTNWGHTGVEIRNGNYLNTGQNRVDRNTYVVPNTSLAYFRWSTGGSNMTWAQFRAAGNEPNGTIRQK